MNERRVVLGVSGSIAAYKSAELVRLFRKAGVSVDVVLTRAGAQFVTPLTLATLTGRPVTIEQFGAPIGPTAGWDLERAHEAEQPGGSAIEHIRASREADLIVVAPATANILAKAAHGIADDALSTTLLASMVPALFAPAMNTRMWEHPATRENVRLLRERGALFVDPETGELACGEFGTGRMAEPAAIVGTALRHLNGQAGLGRVLVTAGGTEEPIDPVRCVTNHSSGRMGFAIAEAARDLGYEVTLVVGRTSAPPPAGVEVVPARTALEMANAVEHLHPREDILIMAAAVADYRPRRATTQKIASGEDRLRIDLVPNPDILAGVAETRRGLVTIGFALETGGDAADRLARARAKLRRKACDLLVLNDPLQGGSQFGGDTSQATLLHSDGRTEALPLLTKYELGRVLLASAKEIRHAKSTAKSTVKSTVKAAPKRSPRPPIVTAKTTSTKTSTSGARLGRGTRGPR